MADDFDARIMYDWSNGLVGIIDGYARHFANAPPEVSRRYMALKQDARELLDSIYEAMPERRVGRW